MKITLFKTKTSFKKKALAPEPGFYWKLVILLVFILILLSFIFGYYMFKKAIDESTVSIENINKKQPVQKEKIQKVLEYFSLREKKSNDILNSNIIVVDPSL